MGLAAQIFETLLCYAADRQQGLTTLYKLVAFVSFTTRRADRHTYKFDMVQLGGKKLRTALAYVLHLARIIRV